MALITVVAGAYAGTYTPNGGVAASLGILADDGYRLAWTIHQQQVGNDGTDKYGQTLLTAVHRGGDWLMTLRCREYSATAMNAAWPYGKVTGGGALSPILAGIGRDVTVSYAGAVILTATAGTPAASNPATFTASSVAAAPGSNSAMEFTSKTREVPMALNLFPYNTTIAAVSYDVWMVTT